jgi:hypothetical protein
MTLTFTLDTVWRDPTAPAWTTSLGP